MSNKEMKDNKNINDRFRTKMSYDNPTPSPELIDYFSSSGNFGDSKEVPSTKNTEHVYINLPAYLGKKPIHPTEETQGEEK